VPHTLHQPDHRGSVLVEQGTNPFCGHNLVVARACGNHRPDEGIVADDEVDHYGPVVDRAGLRNDGRDVFLPIASQGDAAECLGKSDEVRMRRE